MSAVGLAGCLAATSVIFSIGFVLGAWWATRNWTATADRFDLHPEDYGS